MKFCKEAILLSMVALGLGSCSLDDPWTGRDGEGGISLKLTASTDVKDAIPVLRSGTEVLEAPDTRNFAVSLTNISTGEVQKWETLADFTAQNGFRTGSYTLAAFYGSPEDEGFELPYYYGETEVTVLEGRESSAEITATLANSMVSIDYTDAFKGYFKDYKVTIHSEGHSYVEYPADEIRPAFIAPGEVALAVDVTNAAGKSVTLQPASFPAAAAHHYHITFDVNTASVGDAQLQIVFDDSVVTEDVTIDLTDELFSSPAPAVNPEGFSDGELLEALSGNASANNTLKFNVTARGGIQAAVLTFASDDFTPAFGNEIDLVKATPAQQKQLADMGIKVLGLFKNPSTLAYVDVTELPKHLPEGKCAVSLVVKDPYTRVSEPVTLNFTTVPVVVEATPGSAIFGTNQATLYIDYNGADPENNFSFQAFSKAGVYKDVNIVSVAESTRTRSFETKSYIFTITLPDTDRDEIPVKIFFNGAERKNVTIPVVTPDYDVEVDAFAKYAKMKVSTSNSSDLAAVVNSLRIFNNGNLINESNVTRNNESGIITIVGLTPATNYTFGDALTGNSPASTYAVTTESENDVPNGNFSDITETIRFNGVESGGWYKTGVKKNSVNTANIAASEPTGGWASINQKTCYAGSSRYNTWYMVTSTYAEDGAVNLRSVAYDHNGVEIESVTYGALVYRYYNNKLPSVISSRAAGELFLGSYSFDGSEHRNEGIAFSTRPTSVSFDYAYTPYNNEVGEVWITVFDATGAVIASTSAELGSASSMSNKVVTLPAYPFGKKAAKLTVGFRSTKGNSVATLMPSAGDIDGVGSSVAPASGGFEWGDNHSKSFSAGSVLTVDNVKLNY